MRQLSVQDFDRAVLGIGIQLERGQMLDYTDFDDGYVIVKTRHATPVTVGRDGDIIIVPGPQERVASCAEAAYGRKRGNDTQLQPRRTVAVMRVGDR